MSEKKAARTVVVEKKDGEIKTAVISVRGGEYFKIPGGGIEEGESEEQAAIREAREETGSEVILMGEIGRSSFVDEKGVLHSSVCFLAEKINDGDTLFNEWERNNDFDVVWVDLNEAKRMFESSKTDDLFGKKINERDRLFLLKALDMMRGEK